MPIEKPISTSSERIYKTNHWPEWLKTEGLKIKKEQRVVAPCAKHIAEKWDYAAERATAV
jgi:hypothetical protein